jgi:hypothetical protein
MRFRVGESSTWIGVDAETAGGQDGDADECGELTIHGDLADPPSKERARAIS